MFTWTVDNLEIAFAQDFPPTCLPSIAYFRSIEVPQVLVVHVTRVILSLSYGTPKKIGWLVVAYPATEIFGTPNKFLRNKVQSMFSGRKRGYAIFDK